MDRKSEDFPDIPHSTKTQKCVTLKPSDEGKKPLVYQQEEEEVEDTLPILSSPYSPRNTTTGFQTSTSKLTISQQHQLVIQTSSTIIIETEQLTPKVILTDTNNPAGISGSYESNEPNVILSGKNIITPEINKEWVDSAKSSYLGTIVEGWTEETSTSIVEQKIEVTNGSFDQVPSQVDNNGVKKTSAIFHEFLIEYFREEDRRPFFPKYINDPEETNKLLRENMLISRFLAVASTTVGGKLAERIKLAFPLLIPNVIPNPDLDINIFNSIFETKDFSHLATGFLDQYETTNNFYGEFCCDELEILELAQTIINGWQAATAVNNGDGLQEVNAEIVDANEAKYADKNMNYAVHFADTESQSDCSLPSSETE